MNERIIIEAGKIEGQYWRDLYRYRELLTILAQRDLVVRYKQTVVGLAWVLIRPLLTLVVLTVVFHRLAHLPSEDVPYPLLVMAALLPWQLFANALSSSSGSLVGNAHLIAKVYFPRLIIPLSSLLSNLVDFGVTVGLLVLMMLGYTMLGYLCLPGWQIVFLPLFVLLALALAGGCGLWLGALNVRYRDFTHVVPFIVQLGLYISPVGFSSAVVPEPWRFWFGLNPMVGVIDGFRWCLLGGAQPPDAMALLLSLAGTVLLVVSGLWYFRQTERTFADLI